ncbi:N-acetylmuramoyl-L-alanine amidase, partial [Clostridiaceae bacterium NSJ-31]|nr:N-acetylmuramoyl-L-alanine amidase [Ligaoa zhengdingensis]
MNIKEQLIRVNPYSRPGTKIRPTKVIVHYVGNPGSTAQNNRDYFDNLATT